MNKIILLLLLAVVGKSAMADWAGGWTRVGSSGGDTDIYVNASTMHADGNIIKIWYMKDFGTVQEEAAHQYLSITIQGEFDCKETQNRILEYLWYKGNKGGGDVVYNETATSEWKQVFSGSAEDAVFRYACKKKWWQWW